MKLLKKLLILALLSPVLCTNSHHENSDDPTESYHYTNHRKNHNVSHRNRDNRRHIRSHHRDYDDYKHRYHRVGNRPSSRQNFPERVAQPVVTAGGTVADVGEDVVDLRPGEAVEDTVRGAGQTVKDVLAIPFGGRARD